MGIKSSKDWLKRQKNDAYVQKAKAKGYRSRAAFKLLEIQEKDRLIKPGMGIVDIGSAPGGWSQVARELVGAKGFVVAIDILDMDPIAGVDFLQGDFGEKSTVKTLLDRLQGRDVDLVISDLAPNLSGVSAVDQAKSFGLLEEVLVFVEDVLVHNGCFLVKVFHGKGFTEYVLELKLRFKTVVIRKPKASRTESKETYILCKGYKGQRL